MTGLFFASSACVWRRLSGLLRRNRLFTNQWQMQVPAESHPLGRVRSERPLPGSHPDSDAFSAALVAQKLDHACAAEKQASRNKLLQTRRENVSYARDIVGEILHIASRQIAANEIARSAVLFCLNTAACQVESRNAECAANGCVTARNLNRISIVICARHDGHDFASRYQLICVT